MSDIRVTNITGLNIYNNPLERDQGQPIHAVNVDSFPYGAKSKRPGYTTFLNAADSSPINSLFQWIKNDGTTNYIYRASGTKLYYYDAGAESGNWTVCGNGTIASGAAVSHAILGDTLVICDGAGSTRHSTNGISFTDTTLAPVATSLEQYQNRIYAAGTASQLYYSTTGDATNWSTTGTADSSSLTIPGGGKLNKIFKVSDRLMASKNSGQLYKWDGYSLVDTTTNLGPTSPQSVAKVEGYGFWLNRNGIYGYGGAMPELISNPVQRQIYNSLGSGIAGGTFDVASAATHRFDYLLSVGTVTDDFTNRQIDKAVIKYDYQKNEFLNWSFYNFPKSWLSYKDKNGVQQLIFGDTAGQCYKVSNDYQSDNGQAIESVMIFLIDGRVPHLDKKWNHLWAFFNPGNQAKIAVAIENTYNKNSLRWKEIGDCSSGVAEFRFPTGTRGKFLFVKIYESSLNSTYNFYGLTVDAEPIPA